MMTEAQLGKKELTVFHLEASLLTNVNVAVATLLTNVNILIFPTFHYNPTDIVGGVAIPVNCAGTNYGRHSVSSLVLQPDELVGKKHNPHIDWLFPFSLEVLWTENAL